MRAIRYLVICCALAMGLASCGDDNTSVAANGSDQTQPDTSAPTTSPPESETTVTPETTAPPATSTSTPEPPPTTAPPEESLARFLASQPGLVAATGTIDDAGQTRAVFSRAEGSNRYAAAASFDGTAWSVEGEVTLPSPNYPLADGEITYADVTGDGSLDYLVPLDAASGPVSVLLSRQSGEWALVPVGSADGEPYVGLEPRLVDGTIRASGNDCNPTCAEGSPIEVVWRFADGRLVQG